ncbi:ABC transporter ATP-binding protein [Blautia glucerasea]|uniref:ABC transporter ATP-binding protein n=1 Tax=Blautia glucerasea TaxID=536633 RepID=UPI001D5B644A|nr:ABC transporter ATP-binding protein [Blautia glucerasea]NSL02742.1 ABC transporter ATP-binding protein [Blautia glucerasea]
MKKNKEAMGAPKRQVKTVIWQTVKKQKWLSLGIVLAVVGAVVTALIPPLILARIVDTITGGNKAAVYILVLYFAMLALTGFMESAREGLLTVFGQKITHALRSSLMEKFVSLTSDNLTRQEPGTLVSRFVGDVDTVENLFTSGIISMFADACKIISILVVIWFENKGLTVVLLVMLPFLFGFTRHVQKNMLTAQIENRKAVGRASGHVPETLHNIRTIHCLAREKYMEERYDTYIGESYQAMERTNFYDAVYSPVILILNAIVVAVVMLLSASGNQSVLTFFGMSAGTAVAVINYISQIFTPVESLGMEIQTIQSAVAGIHRINEFLALEEKSQVVAEGNMEVLKDEKFAEHAGDRKNLSDFSKKSVSKSGVPFVEFKDVTFGYDEHVVLEHLNFKVMDTDQVTLLGRTGAGKSTILKLLLGLYQPDQGEVLIHGMPAAAVRAEERRKLFGYVEQSFHMVPGTVRDQITLYDNRISDRQVKAVAELTGLKEAIERLENGYDTICTPEIFSKGQWQLLSIARAAAAEPKMLLLDEITANLDAETEKSVLVALKRVAKDRTVISISHRTSAELGRTISI